MAIPTLASYELPGADDLPYCPLRWTLQPQRAALLIHDMQRYFLNFYDDGFPQLIANIARLRGVGVPVFYTRQPPGQSVAERGLLLQRWGPGLAADDEIAAELTPDVHDTVITKRRYSAFFANDFAATLRESGRDQLMISGVYAHIGITATALDAFAHDIAPFVVADAIADFDRDLHMATLRHLAATCATVTTTEALAPRHAAD